MGSFPLPTLNPVRFLEQLLISTHPLRKRLLWSGLHPLTRVLMQTAVTQECRDPAQLVKRQRQNDRKKAQAIQRVTPQSGAAGAREEDPHVTSQDRKAVARHLVPAPSLFNKLTAPHIATLCQP